MDEFKPWWLPDSGIKPHWRRLVRSVLLEWLVAASFRFLCVTTALILVVGLAKTL